MLASKTPSPLNTNILPSGTRYRIPDKMISKATPGVSGGVSVFVWKWFGLGVGSELVWVVDGQDVEDVFPVGDFSCEVFASWSFFLGCGVRDFEGCLFGWEVSPLPCCSTEPGVEGLDRIDCRDQRAKPVLWFWASLFCCRRQVGAHEVHCIGFCTLGMRPLRVRRLRGGSATRRSGQWVRSSFSVECSIRRRNNAARRLCLRAVAVAGRPRIRQSDVMSS